MKMIRFVLILFLLSEALSLAPFPTGSAIDQIITASFNLVDRNNDSVVVRDELAGFPVGGDLNHDGCMSLDEYKQVTAGTAETATRLFHNLDPDHSDCLTYAKISHQFDIMDKDNSGTANFKEFDDWYKDLLFNHPVVG